MRGAMMRALLLFAGALAATQAHATVFDDAYDCVKAQIKVASIAADKGPKAIEFITSQPQCVALVTSPAPFPTTMMVATIALAAKGVLPQQNPACEGALYTAAAKPIAAILDEVGILPADMKKMLADEAATAALGEAIQKIPGASVAFASFSCGCGMTDAGLNPPTISMVYKAIKDSGEKCTAVMANLVEGGSEALVQGVSNLGDVMAGQTKHMDPQKYFQLIFLPRMPADYEQYGPNTYFLDVNLSKTTVPQCEHYFDKHTMSAINANKTCVALSEQYIAQYKNKLPVLAEKSQVNKLRAGYPAIAFSFQSDKTKPGQYCTAAGVKAYPAQPGVYPNEPARYRYMQACLMDMGQYYGYEVKRDQSYSSQNRYLVKKVSDQQWTTRIIAAAKKPNGMKAAQILEKVQGQLMAEWQKQEAQKAPQWIAAINAELDALDANKKKSDLAFQEQNKKKQAEDKVKNDKAVADALAKAQAGCKDERCKVETAEWIAACKPYGTESQVMNGQIACSTNLGVTVDISVVRADFNAQLDSQVKKHLAVACPLNMDCTTGITKQRVEIEAAANKVWDYGRDQALKRALVDGSRKAVVNEVAQMIAPVKARQVVSANQPKGAATADLGNNRKDPGSAYKPPPSVVQVQAPPKVETLTPPKPISTPPKDYKLPPPTVVTSAPPPTTMAAPPPTAKPPGFGSAATGSLGGGASSGGLSGSFPKGGNLSGGLGQGAAAGSMKIEGCEPRGVQDPTILVCGNDAALNRCRSLLVSGKVKSCIAK